MDVSRQTLLSTRVLARSALWSLAAQGLPAAVAVLAIPAIVDGLGVERFGLLAIAWMVIGYFSLFDLGISRALTKFAAESLVSHDRAGVDGLIWTAWYVMLVLGLTGAIALAALTPWLVGTALDVPGAMAQEATRTFYLLAVSVPIVVLTAGFRGLLEAAQRFGLTSFVKIPIGVSTFLLPLAVLAFTNRLDAIVLALVGVRFAGAVAYAVMCHAAVHPLGAPRPFDRAAAQRLFGFGAWMTVSNIVSPLMVSADRMFVGALISVSAVAYYATPFEAVTKLLIIPGAIAAVVFPAFSTAASSDRELVIPIFRVGFRVVLLTLLPFVAATTIFAPQILRLWLGDAFALESSAVLRWLSLGVLMNGLAAMPFALLQGLGRADITAKIHLAEAPLYLILMLWLIDSYGIVGASVAWSVRTTADLIVLYWFAHRMGRGRLRDSFGDLAVPFSLTGILGFAYVAEGTPLKVLLMVLVLVLGLLTSAVWFGSLIGARTSAKSTVAASDGGPYQAGDWSTASSSRH